jgi:hypothetical protein
VTELEKLAQSLAAAELDDADGAYDWYALTEEIADRYYEMARAQLEAAE